MRTKKAAAGSFARPRGGFACEDPGDDRLSRQRHYHGPGGLNGRVRNGNGCDPASMVAGKAAGGRSGRAGRDRSRSVVAQRSTSIASVADLRPRRPIHLRTSRGIVDLASRIGESTRDPVRAASGEAAADRGGQAAWLLGPVGCGGRPPCTPGLSTWSSSRSLRSNCCRKPRLGGGFALRCLQRLSCPDLATRRCPERDSRHTRGRSSPILSY